MVVPIIVAPTTQRHETPATLSIDQVASSHIDTDAADPTVSATFDSRISVETGVARTTTAWATVPSIEAHNAPVGEPTSNRANAKR